MLVRRPRARNTARCGLHFTLPTSGLVWRHLRRKSRVRVRRAVSAVSVCKRREKMAVHMWLALLISSLTYHCTAMDDSVIGFSNSSYEATGHCVDITVMVLNGSLGDEVGLTVETNEFSGPGDISFEPSQSFSLGPSSSSSSLTVCVDPPPVENMTFTIYLMNEGDVGSGHVGSGSGMVMPYDISLRPNSTQVTLRAVDCGDLTGPSNGQVLFTTTTFQSVATYECDPGFNLVGDMERTCQASGEWNGTAPSCNSTATTTSSKVAPTSSPSANISSSGVPVSMSTMTSLPAMTSPPAMTSLPAMTSPPAPSPTPSLSSLASVSESVSLNTSSSSLLPTPIPGTSQPPPIPFPPSTSSTSLPPSTSDDSESDEFPQPVIVVIVVVIVLLLAIAIVMTIIIVLVIARKRRRTRTYYTAGGKFNHYIDVQIKQEEDLREKTPDSKDVPIVETSFATDGNRGSTSVLNEAYGTSSFKGELARAVKVRSQGSQLDVAGIEPTSNGGSTAREE